MMDYGPPERVYVESEWYDGPRSGIADVGGRPHRFQSLFDEAEGEDSSTFFVWPIDDADLALELEQWGIFVLWTDRHDAGLAKPSEHLAHIDVNRRWDELDQLLKTSRTDVPDTARRAFLRIEPVDRSERYTLEGPNYLLRWRLD